MKNKLNFFEGFPGQDKNVVEGEVVQEQFDPYPPHQFREVTEMDRQATRLSLANVGKGKRSKAHVILFDWDANHKGTHLHGGGFFKLVFATAIVLPIILVLLLKP